MVGVALKSYAQKLSVLLAVYGAHTCCTLRMFGIVPATFPDDKLATRYGVHDRRANGRGTPAQRTRSLGLGYKLCAAIPVAGQRTHGTTFRALKVAYRVATPGAESAVYDCLVEVAVRIRTCTRAVRGSRARLHTGSP